MKMPVMMSAMPSSWRVMAVGVHAARILSLVVAAIPLQSRGPSRSCSVSVTRLVDYLREVATITKIPRNANMGFN